MISTDPKFNKPEKVRCDFCGETFIKQPWTSVYSQHDRLVTLCDSCAKKALDSGEVGLIIY